MEKDDIGLKLRERMFQGGGAAGFGFTFGKGKTGRKNIVPRGFALLRAATVRERNGVAALAQFTRRREDVSFCSAEGAEAFVNEEESHGRDGGGVVGGRNDTALVHAQRTSTWPEDRAESNHSRGEASGENSGHAWTSSTRRLLRARAMRLFTVPMLMPKVRAISP